MKTYIIRYLVGITVLIAMVYGSIMNLYLFNGLEASTRLDMEIAGARFNREYKKNPHAILPHTWKITAYLGLEQLPKKFQAIFPEKRHEHRKVIWEESENHAENDINDCAGIVFMPYDLYDGNRLFLLKMYTEDDLSLVDGPGIDLMRMMVIPLGIAVVALVLFTVRYMLKKLYRPVRRLTVWADELDHAQLSAPVPDFGFEEVNLLAGRLHNSMKELGEILQREERFLRNASHELRTPLAILQSNMELLDRICPNPEKAEIQPRQRIKRTISNMNCLTETLLWLGMDSSRIPDPETVVLNDLVAELVAESRYLLAKKQVRVDLISSPATVRVVAHAARIAVGNLIRNGFQYTAEGSVEIHVAGPSVTVKNVNRNSMNIDNHGSDYGHGLGLILVAQIAEKSNWHYANKAIPGGREATLDFEFRKGTQ
jgi:signal transduction histidine kinase